MKKKILIYSSKSYKLFNDKSLISYGGAEVESYLIAKELSKNKDFEVKVLLNKDVGDDLEIKNNIYIKKIVNLSTKNIFKKVFNLFQFLVLFFLEVKNSDYVFQEMSTFETGVIAFYSKLLNKKFIYRIASDKELNGDFKINNRHTNLFFEYGLRNATYILAQTNFQFNLVKKINKDTLLIPSSLPIPKKESREFKNNNFTFLWVGRLDKVKQPEIFIKLALLFPKYKFIIVGPYRYKNEYVKKILLKIKQVKNIEYYNFIKRDKLDIFYKNSSFLVNSSKYEGFPYTMLEAFVNSLPIISLNYNSDDFITKNKLGFFAKGKLGSIEKFIINLNEKIILDFSNNVYNYVKKNHNIELNSKKLIEIIKNE